MKNVKVANVINEFTAVLNYGSNDGAEKGQQFIIYSIGDEIFDPDTHQSLGYLEIVKGVGEIIYVQPQICTISSASYKNSLPIITHRQDQFNSFKTETVEQVEPKQLPFNDIKISDLAKRIK